ncbi:MATH domain and coiled-coil domain-containing protein At3g58360 isoform X1 [Arabidopsis lyrata subsp. lyrata]|nr:MATH domain and coiled-coil domain-containing protein At3g58360 isoform X1 [Arabidopsis lyrata subsp. lyrata]|eukprot:XP_002894297.2 MATH domain and coiled-coil domain-containing protein At3g58360 isoform X1 [Arabidopsis lyrata subsp. lyrata]
MRDLFLDYAVTCAILNLDFVFLTCQDPMFTWVIRDFKSLQDRRVQSEEFNVDGCTWSVLVYPNGKEGDNYLSASLLVSNFQDLPPGWWITTNFSLCIETNSRYRRRVLAASEKCFDANNPSWGKIYWLHRRELNGFLVNGDLKIVAQVEVLNKSTHEEIDLDYEHC